MNSPFATVVRELSLHPEWVRAAVWIIVALLGGVALWAVVQIVPLVRERHTQFTGRMSVRMVGWALPVIEIVLLSVGLLISVTPARTGPFAAITAPLVVALIVPFIAGIQAALLFSPEDEPLIELALTYPRPFAWIPLERFGVMLIIHAIIGGLGTLLASAMSHTDAGALLMSWLPAALLTSGVGLRVTIGTRQIVFGASAAVAVIGALGMFGEPMVRAYPFMWPFALYLPASAVDFPLNRIFLALIGIGLVITAADRLRDSEYVLAGALRKAA